MQNFVRQQRHLVLETSRNPQRAKAEEFIGDVIAVPLRLIPIEYDAADRLVHYSTASYLMLRGGLTPSVEATQSGPMRTPDMASGLESFRNFNKLRKREQTYSTKFVIVHQMVAKIIFPDIHSYNAFCLEM